MKNFQFKKMHILQYHTIPSTGQCPLLLSSCIINQIKEKINTKTGSKSFQTAHSPQDDGKSGEL